MHIAFLTLFLGLVSGRVPVELLTTGGGLEAPGGSPAVSILTIELVLDGKGVGTLAGPPFRGEVDFGAALLPHRLIARGLDAEGRELARAEQWLNLPRPPAEIEAVPEPATAGRPGAVRVLFHSLTHETPAEVGAVLDGKPLAASLKADGQSARIALPALPPDTPHLLSIDVLYPSGLTARRDLAFGFGGEVSTELTAVPLRARRGAIPTQPGELAGWFTGPGTAADTGPRPSRAPLRVTAVEEGPGELLIVRAPGVPPTLEALGQRRVRTALDTEILPGLPGTRSTQLPDRLAALRFDMKLGATDRVRFLHPTTQRFADDAADAAEPGKTAAGRAPVSELFPSSQSFSAEEGGLYWLLTRVVHEALGPARLADAVAVAGLQALTANHRRAVLLVLDREAADASRYDPPVVRAYLAAIHVPLHVWQIGKPNPRTAALWGQVTAIETLNDLSRAARELARDLAGQRIVWLDGRHLPQSIALSPAAAGRAELVAGRAR